MHKVPDYLEPIVGWRLWNSHNPQGYLRALSYSYYWVPGRVRKTVCDACGQPCKPSVDTHIGFHAFNSVKHLVEQEFRGIQYRDTFIVGEVYLWGTIIVCEFGYRAEYAYPKSLLVPSEHSQTLLSEVWKIPVEVGNIKQLFQTAVQNVAQLRGVE